MPPPLITLTTDFGTGSPYVAAMKGVVLALNPDARLLDLSHDIPPQDLRHAAHFLATALPCFPPGVLHVIVVDPGVGSERAALYVDAGGHRLLVPDNGCWTPFADRVCPCPEVRRLTEPRYWRQPVSATFHGRDVFAPAAAHLSLGVEPRELGSTVAAWVRLELPAPVITLEGIAGEILFVDHFGNLITNIPAGQAAPFHGKTVHVGPHEVTRWVRTYADAEPGSVVALVSSSGQLEIAVVQGNAARRLQAAAGMPVTVR
jgi:S-adenosyl-L-methionine hydrolase (adenosine-forming)